MKERGDKGVEKGEKDDVVYDILMYEVVVLLAITVHPNQGMGRQIRFCIGWCRGVNGDREYR